MGRILEVAVLIYLTRSAESCFSFCQQGKRKYVLYMYKEVEIFHQMFTPSWVIKL